MCAGDPDATDDVLDQLDQQLSGRPDTYGRDDPGRAQAFDDLASGRL